MSKFCFASHMEMTSTRDEAGISCGGADPFSLAPFLSDLCAAEFLQYVKSSVNYWFGGFCGIKYTVN